MNPDILRLAHERVANGSLPLMEQFKTYGARGSGEPCALCGIAISPEGVEIVVESEGLFRAVPFHVKCQAAWQVAIANQREIS